MSQTQFGHTLFLNGFQDGSTAEKLCRLHFSSSGFSSNGSAGARYDEKWLQCLIMRHPGLLPIDQIEPAFNPLIPICTELSTGSGYVDNLPITPAGDIALVECKLWRNPEARQKVIAQIIGYAKDISGWDYQRLEEAVRGIKQLDGSDRNTKQSLYELVSEKSDVDETSFHDTLSRNLKRGRFLLLIVGDGIREGVESIAAFLQQHAGFHFTLAFVELALFKLHEGYIAQPRVLVKTANIERGIVSLAGDRVVITSPNGGKKSDAVTITQEHYSEQIENTIPGISAKLQAFLDDLENYGVSPEFGKATMILRWHADDGKGWNLGTLSSRGEVFTDSMSWQAKDAGLLEPLQQYLKKLAGLVPGSVVKKGKTDNVFGIIHNGKSLTVAALLADDSRKNAWVRAIADFQVAVRERTQ